MKKWKSLADIIRSLLNTTHSVKDVQNHLRRNFNNIRI